MSDMEEGELSDANEPQNELENIRPRNESLAARLGPRTGTAPTTGHGLQVTFSNPRDLPVISALIYYVINKFYQ